MDWQRFSRLISLCSDHPETKSQLNLAGSSEPTLPLSECAELFSQLLHSLSECASVEECATQYPQAGTLLTRASLSPILCTDEINSKLILQCLMEYTKMWNAPYAPLEQQDASKLWCLTRMRRLMYGPSSSDLDIDGLIHQVYSKIFVSNLIVRPRQLYDVSNLCIPLLKAPNAAKLFKELINAAFDVAEREKASDVEEYTLSSNFIEAFLEQCPDLYKTVNIYPNRWSVCTKFVEYDLLSLLTDVFNLPWGIWFDFMDIDHLLQDGHLPDPEFLIAMYRISDIYSRAFPFMASIAVSSKDWRVMQVLQVLQNFLFTHIKSRIDDSDDEEIRMIFPPCTNHPELDRLKRYFPTDLHGLLEQPSVTFLQLNQRIEQCLFTRLAAYQEVRNQIWLVLMLSGSLLRNIASQVMKTDSCQETLTAIHLLSWLCCPTDDERLDQTERAIVSWLVTVERDKADLPLMAERFRYAKDNVFNGNLNCWYHCLFWILLPHKLEDVYNCILCIVTDDLPLIQLAIWHLVSNHCPLPDPISSVVAKRLKLRTATTL